MKMQNVIPERSAPDSSLFNKEIISKKKPRFDSSISFIRVLAMLSIIFGHVCTAYGINTYQLGGIGVEIFLFISGFLYGKYIVDSSKTFLLRRWRRLVPPLWITVIIYCCICLFIKTEVHIKPLFVYAVNAQGIWNIFRGVKLPVFQGMGQTWFVTVIFLCYVLMVFLKNSKLEMLVSSHPVVALLVSVALQMCFCYVGVQLSYILQFFIGYFISLKREKNEDNGSNWVTAKRIIVVFFLAVVLSAVRIVVRKNIDGSILYDMIIARLSFNALGICIIMILTLISKLSKIERLTHRKLWKTIDKLSYPLYLTHYMFLQGPMKVDSWLDNTIIQIVTFSFLTIIAAIVVFVIDSKMLKQEQVV